jgi:hypothetical protein
MKTAGSDLKAKIQHRMADASPSTVWTPRDFLDLAGRDAVDKALQRQVKVGGIRRIDRGLYDQPTLNSLTKRLNPPAARSVIEAVARRDQIRVLVDGMTAANDLGLTTAVPAKIVVHTDARLKPIALGAQEILFKPTAASKLFWAGRPAMRVVQALHWLRDMLDRSGEADILQRRLSRILAEPDHGPALRKDLTDGLQTLPAWMQEVLKTLLAQALEAAASRGGTSA